MKKLITAIGAASLAIALAACGGTGAGTNTDGGLPNQLVWTTQAAGTATYTDLAAVADAVTSSDKGTSVRIITSETSVGRMTPVVEGQAHMTRLGDENIYAFEGDYDFASDAWGPQDISITWAPVTDAGLFVKENSGIDSLSDLEGKRLPQPNLTPSPNNKIEAYLASVGLSLDDVELVKMGYGEQADALQSGQIDALFSSVSAGNLVELNGITPLKLLDLAGPDVDQDVIAEMEPSTEIRESSGGPNPEANDGAATTWYALPLVSMADADEDMVYEAVKLINETYDSYKDTTQTMSSWNTDNAMLVPTEVPFHPGMVKYLEEQGLWTEEAAERNEALLQRGETLRSEWPKYVEQAGDNINHEDWNAWKDENVPG